MNTNPTTGATQVKLHMSLMCLHIANDYPTVGRRIRTNHWSYASETSYVINVSAYCD